MPAPPRGQGAGEPGTTAPPDVTTEQAHRAELGIGMPELQAMQSYCIVRKIAALG